MERNDFHPIAREAASQRVMEDETVTISATGRVRLERALAALFDTVELPWAVRSLLGLPLSLPSTTGVPQPATGGDLWRA